MTAFSIQSLLQQMPEWTDHCHTGSVKVLNSLHRCRTAALGYHLYSCDNADCGNKKLQYHSCRNRHCPNCGGSRQQAWVEARLRELIPCKYYHVVFTMPHQLNSIVMGNRRAMFSLLFDAAHYTLQRFGKDPQYLGGTAGIISILHTWGQNLSFHPHVHCIVSGGGLDANGHWLEAKKVKYNSLYPPKAMDEVYRGRFLYLLKKAVANGTLSLPAETHLPTLLNKLYKLRWVVYSKQPFGGPAQVIEYLGRYTHRVAISNRRIRHIDDQNNVTFDYKDYADGNRKKRMTLSGEEFLRRFEQHILPAKFCKIRSCGLYANNGRRSRITTILEQLDVPPHPDPVQIPWQVSLMAATGIDPLQCTCCKTGSMVLMAIVRGAVWQSQLLKPPE